MKRYGVEYTKEQNAIYTSNWRKKNKEKHDEYLRAYYQKKKLAKMIENGEIIGLACILAI